MSRPVSDVIVSCARAIFRSLEELPNGTYRLRPGPEETSSLLHALDEINLLKLYPQLTRPCLVVRATEAAQAPAGLPWLAELQRVHLASETRGLEELMRSHPAFRLELLQSTHARLLSDPRVAGLITTFLDQQSPNGRKRQ